MDEDMIMQSMRDFDEGKSKPIAQILAERRQWAAKKVTKTVADVEKEFGFEPGSLDPETLYLKRTAKELSADLDAISFPGFDESDFECVREIENYYATRRGLLDGPLGYGPEVTAND